MGFRGEIFFDNRPNKSNRPNRANRANKANRFLSEGDFAADVGVEAGGYGGGGEAKAEEIHQFCDGCFGGHVVAGDYAGVGEFVTCDVAAVVDTAVDTLGDIYNHYAALDRLGDFLDEPT